MSLERFRLPSLSDKLYGELEGRMEIKVQKEDEKEVKRSKIIKKKSKKL